MKEEKKRKTMSINKKGDKENRYEKRKKRVYKNKIK
jgi:hypothetical protein